MKVVLKLPKLSMNMDEATVVTWHRNVGEGFAAGDIIYSVETEKVTSDIEAPCAGTMLEILVAAGGEAEVGQSVCRIDKTD
ncbi:MAG: lipoyl domain-containing protein [Pseudomonadota bacterium]